MNSGPTGASEVPEIVLLMLSNFGPADGGRETWAYQFVPRLLERYPKYRLTIVGLRLGDEPDYRPILASCVPKDAQHRVSLRIISMKRDRFPNALRFIQAIRAAFRLPQPQVRLVIAVGSVVELLAAMSARGWANAGKIVWLRSIFMSEKEGRYPRAMRPLLEGLERLVLSRADGIIANGEDTAFPYRMAGLNVQVIPNATELRRWAITEPRFELPLSVAFIGRLAAVKGIREFLEAIRLISRTSSASCFQFHVIGDGPEKPSVMAAESANLLRYHGQIANEDMPELLTRIDICVALTFGNSNSKGVAGGAGTSNAAIEQMAAGRLLICWDNAPFRQLADDTSALFVEEGSSTALARELLEVASRRTLGLGIARSGRQRSAAFGFERHMDLFNHAAESWLG